MEYYEILLLAHVSISWILANYFQEVAKMKGHEGKRYFWLPFLFAIGGYLLVIALPEKKLLQNNFSSESMYGNFQEKLQPVDKNSDYNDLPDL